MNNAKYLKEEPAEPLILEPEDWSPEEWKTILKLFGMESADRIKISDYAFEAYGVEKGTNEDTITEEPKPDMGVLEMCDLLDSIRKSYEKKLCSDVKREVCIRVPNSEEKLRIGNKIHNQLVGNQDYIGDRIILSMSQDTEPNDTVVLTVFNDSETDPEIKI